MEFSKLKIFLQKTLLSIALVFSSSFLLAIDLGSIKVELAEELSSEGDPLYFAKITDEFSVELKSFGIEPQLLRLETLAGDSENPLYLLYYQAGPFGTKRFFFEERLMVFSKDKKNYYQVADLLLKVGETVFDGEKILAEKSLKVEGKTLKGVSPETGKAFSIIRTGERWRLKSEG